VSDTEQVPAGPAPPEQSPATATAASIERNGINVIAESERKGKPADLFWPWFAANISVLGVAYGAFVLGFGVSFWQGVIAGVVGVDRVVRALRLGGAGRQARLRADHGAVPGAFGVRGNRLPSVLSWLLTVGWETVLVILATLATATVLDRLGWGGGTGTKIVAMIVVAGDHDRRRRARLRVHHAAADLDHRRHRRAHRRVRDPVRRHHLLVRGQRDPGRLGPGVHRRAGVRHDRLRARLGQRRRGLLALPARRSSAAACSAGPRSAVRSGRAVLIVFGLLLAGSSQQLSQDIGSDPIGALAEVLPTWFLVPFAIVAGARPDGRRRAGHLLVRAVPAGGRHPHPAAPRPRSSTA
jgi:hypothetical protein